MNQLEKLISKCNCFVLNVLIILFVFNVFYKLTCKVQIDITVRSPSKCS